MKKIPYGKQLIDKKDKKLVFDALSNELITTGPIVKRFELKLKKFFKCKYSYTCSSGPAALHLAMLSAGLKKNDTILMPAINFIASYNMAKIMNLKVYLVDVDKLTGQITPDKIEECIKKNKLKKLKALVIMYHGGYPENSKNFYKLKKKYNFLIIEDACHALGSEYFYKNQLYKIGSCKHADISTFSLHPVKTITTGEGGIITTNNFNIAKNIKLYRNHGILRAKKNYWEYDIVDHGFNYRLSDINSALGLSQLKKINKFLKQRKKIYDYYISEFTNFNSYFKTPKYSNIGKFSFHLFLINIEFNKLKKNKKHFMRYLLGNNIITQQHYIPIYKFRAYKENSRYFPGAEKFFDNSLSIPIFVDLSFAKQKFVIKTIKDYFKN